MSSSCEFFYLEVFITDMFTVPVCRNWTPVQKFRKRN